MTVRVFVVRQVFDLHEKLTLVKIILHQRQLIVTVGEQEIGER